MRFTSDTEAPAHPALLAALAKVNHGPAASYGADAATTRVTTRLAEVFETEVSVFLATSGTAANALALSVLCPPDGAILCHREAHIERDERGAPEFFTGGAKLRLLPGDHGRIDMAALEAELAARDPSFVHETPAQCLSLTNLTECGATYTPEALAARIAPAKAAGLTVHLDGARFANAVVSLNASPADLSWRAGVDALCFGATKNGALACEAIVLFGAARTRFDALCARAKRAGHMPAKMRFLAAQMEALLADDLWLALARDANAAAARLAATLCAAHGARLAHPVEGNEVFVALPQEAVARLRAAGAAFYPWPGGLWRFVCAWTTTAEEIEALAAVAAPTPSSA